MADDGAGRGPRPSARLLFVAEEEEIGAGGRAEGLAAAPYRAAEAEVAVADRALAEADLPLGKTAANAPLDWLRAHRGEYTLPSRGQAAEAV